MRFSAPILITASMALSVLAGPIAPPKYYYTDNSPSSNSNTNTERHAPIAVRAWHGVVKAARSHFHGSRKTKKPSSATSQTGGCIGGNCNLASAELACLPTASKPCPLLTSTQPQPDANSALINAGTDTALITPSSDSNKIVPDAEKKIQSETGVKVPQRKRRMSYHP